MLAAYVLGGCAQACPVRLNFICTHNSRRSHLAQLWAAAAAHENKFAHVEIFSGGTEATAFDHCAVAAIQRAGFQVACTTRDSNPSYQLRFSDQVPPVTSFSKVFDQAPNPQGGFAAVLVCSDADAACPVVPGAEQRFAIPYIDPEVADDTPDETATYDLRCRQIAREMLYVFVQARAAT